ncbi:MAG: hypothetical protein ACOC7T_01280 [Planctomycetota bacterium]
MSNFFTDGRLGLVAELQGDPEIDGRVKTWFDYGPGLARRHGLEPALCPVLAVAPAEGRPRPVANVERQVAQVLGVQVATDGADVAPCEELAALVVARVQAADATKLGLAAEGLTALRVPSVTWASHPRQDAARLIWAAEVEVELLWRRT